MTQNKQCIIRLQKEYRALIKDPIPHITAHPLPSNLLEWHFVLEGARGTEFDGGIYHGKIVFPPQYPFKPPSLSLFTPNGRFATQTKLCLSMTDYHPESWNPMWSVGTILNGLLSFMYDNQATTGSISTTTAEKRRLAKESLAFNVKNPTFRKLFEDFCQQYELEQQQQQQQQQENSQQENELAKSTRGGIVPLPNPPTPLPTKKSSPYLTIAIIAVVIAIAAVPLISSKFPVSRDT